MRSALAGGNLRRRGVDHARPDLKQTTIGHLCGSELPYNRLRTKTGADGGTRSPIAGNPGKGKVISLFGLLGFLARRFDFSSFSSSAIRSFSSRAGSRADVAGYGVQFGLHVADKIVGGASGSHGQYLQLCRLCPSDGNSCHIRHYLDLNAVVEAVRVCPSAH